MKKMTKGYVESEVAIKLRMGSDSLLTDKEAIIASYLVLDYTVNDIAALLFRSKNTIKKHIINIKKKCNCVTHTRLGAILQGFIKNNPEGYVQSALEETN